VPFSDFDEDSLFLKIPDIIPKWIMIIEITRSEGLYQSW
jgi:hypothetical protein